MPTTLEELLQDENRRLKAELAQLRRTIIKIEPLVLIDGRFEQMITAPINVIRVAQQILQNLPQTQSDNVPAEDLEMIQVVPK